MAEAGFETVTLSREFYRDGFKKVVYLIISVFVSIIILGSVSLYLYLSKPEAVVFPVGKDWRIQAPVPVDQPYLTSADVLQWVSDVLPNVFTCDFNRYNEQLRSRKYLFTDNGWTVFLNQLNIYVNYNNVLDDRLFVSAAPASAPTILNQGLLSGRYAWWVQMPVDFTYAGQKRTTTASVSFRVLVVRAPTVDNLMGVAIDNVIVASSSGSVPTGSEQQP